MTLDERIRDNLGRAAGMIEVASPRSVDLVRRTSIRRRVFRDTGWGLLAVVLIAGLVFLANSNPGIGGSELADGDVLRAGAPRVVQGLPGPAPQFDTSGLGEEVQLQPIDDPDDSPDAIQRFVQGEIFLVTVLGETSDGTRAYVTHSLGSTDGREMVFRCHVAVGGRATGGGGCGGEWVDNADALSDGLIPPESFQGPSHVVGGPAELMYTVSPDTSVVMLTVNGDRQWQRPISQVAVFITDLRDGDLVQLTSFDSVGEVIDQWRFVADDGTEPIVDEEAGPTDDGVTVTTAADEQPIVGDCPVTVPRGRDFLPPEGYPVSPGATLAWFGNGDLWTALPVDGAYEPRKSEWWSQNFPGGDVEEHPPITVTWNRVDERADPIVDTEGTNAYTEEDGWFMIADGDPDMPGCWEVTAEYKGASLSYVYVRP